MKHYGKTETKEVYKEMRRSVNPVTKSVLREILIKRIECGDILPAKPSFKEM